MESQLRWLLLNKDKDSSLFHRLLQSEAENEKRPKLNPFDGLLSRKEIQQPMKWAPANEPTSLAAR
jgi:hypothetical protein